MFRFTSVILMVAFSALTCGKKKYDTPEAALAALQDACLQHDSKAFVSVLSKETIGEFQEKIEKWRSQMPESTPENPYAAHALEQMGQNMGMPYSKLKDLTVEGFIAFMMQNAGATGSETTLLPAEMLPPAKVARRTERGNKAILYFADDKKLSFIKTEAGWKLHLDAEEVNPKGLSSKDGENQE